MNIVILPVLVFVSAAASAASSSGVIAIIKQEQDISPDGSFTSKWETANGISVEERGSLKSAGQKDEAEVIEGSATWTAPDGTKLDLRWIADENGAKFQGDHLPTPPPPLEIPIAIQRALDWIFAHPYEKESDRKL